MLTSYTAMKFVAGSTGLVTVNFVDENGLAVAPATLNWTLRDAHGTVVNSRQNVNVPTPSSSETITLSGNDLPCPAGLDETTLFMKFEGTYGGSSYPIVGELAFYVQRPTW